MLDQFKQALEDMKLKFEKMYKNVTATNSSSPSELVLVSPDGSKQVVIKAENEGVGMWFQVGVDEPMIALYNGYGSQGAVVGVYAKQNSTRATPDAAIYVVPEKVGGFIQLVGPDNVSHDFMFNNLVFNTVIN